MQKLQSLHLNYIVQPFLMLQYDLKKSINKFSLRISYPIFSTSYKINILTEVGSYACSPSYPFSIYDKIYYFFLYSAQLLRHHSV